MTCDYCGGGPLSELHDAPRVHGNPAVCIEALREQRDLERVEKHRQLGHAIALRGELARLRALVKEAT